MVRIGEAQAKRMITYSSGNNGIKDVPGANLGLDAGLGFELATLTLQSETRFLTIRPQLPMGRF